MTTQPHTGLTCRCVVVPVALFTTCVYSRYPNIVIWVPTVTINIQTTFFVNTLCHNTKANQLHTARRQRYSLFTRLLCNLSTGQDANFMFWAQIFLICFYFSTRKPQPKRLGWQTTGLPPEPHSLPNIINNSSYKNVPWCYGGNG